MNATKVEIIDYLPSGLTYISNDKNVTDIDVAVKNNVITWNIDNLANGTAIKLIITVRTNAIGNWTNVVNVTCHENNTIVSDNATVEVVPVILNVTKAVNVTVVGNNTFVNFTITVNNTSLVNASDIVINDILPSGLTYVDSNGTYTKSLITTVVAFTRAVLFTTIVKLTKVLLPTTVTLAVLLIVTLTGTTSTVALALTIVLFSLQVTLTRFVQLPIALDLAVIHNLTCVLLVKLAIFQLTDSIPLDLV